MKNTTAHRTLYIKEIAVIVVATFIGIITFLPAENRDYINILLAHNLSSVITDLSFINQDIKTSLSSVATNMNMLDNIGHFLAFSLCGALVYRFSKRHSNLLLLASIVLIAGASELSQNFVAGRDPGWGDFLIDTVGGLTGFLIATGLARIRNP